MEHSILFTGHMLDKPDREYRAISGSEIKKSNVKNKGQSKPHSAGH